MALSNMLREPRRELTESAVGVGASGCVVKPDSKLIISIGWKGDNRSTGGPGDAAALSLAMVLGLMFGIILFLVGAALLIATHALGDRICDALDKRGLPLRPVRRYRP